MRNILIIFLLSVFCLFVSCAGNNSSADKDNDFKDSDDSSFSDVEEEFDSDFEDMDSVEEEDDDNPYEGPDFEEPDEDFSWKTCIPVPETEDELCFWPRETDVPCLLPDRYYVDFILSRNSKGNYNSKSVGLNDRYYYFMQSVPEYTLTIYRCSRSTGIVKKIVTNKRDMSSDGYFLSFDIGEEYLVFSYSTIKMNGDRDQSCYLGKMEGDWELKRIAGFDKDCHEPQVVWPYVVYREQWPGWLHVYDIRTGEDRKLEGYKVYSFHHDGKKVYINAIIGTGDEAINSDIFSKGPFPSGIFEVDLETFEVIPVEIFLRKSPHAPFIYGSYLIYSTRREWTLYSSDYWSRNGMAIVLYDLFNRTETILTDTMTGNNGRAFINYPYAGWVDGSEYDGSEGGWQKVVNLETDDEWTLNHSVKDMRDPVVMKNYSVIYFAIVGGTTVDDIEGVCVAEFHEPGKVELNETCHDSNPCTDDIYSVTLQKCTNIPNRSNCDDGDAVTPVDVCTEGKCKGYQTVADTTEMMEIPAGEYYIGNYSPPADLIDPDERPWERWGDNYNNYLPLYYIDKYEVTQKDYRECVDAGICSEPAKKRSGWRSDYWGNPEYDNYPVLYVNYYEAEKYCKWRYKRLPTEFEWVKAANGGEMRWYPWGDVDPDSDNRFGNIFYSLNETKSYDTAEVGTYPLDISPFGVMDLNGNVSEWTASNWTRMLGYEATYGDKLKVVKGGRWEENSNYSGWIAQRMAATPWTSSNTVGFRCVKD
ncbi:MAG: SUMF1/EgtB/PvdO family nonheme iron enzyme [bacterium]|jgi:formylglycine-generating enzyme required for sulfatase activity|nr:SUMF1/EgtB/PvdO family nonheme iron enzyme [bacterium]